MKISRKLENLKAVTCLKYSEEAEANLEVVAIVVVFAASVILVALRSNMRQSAVFHELSQEVQGSVWVNDAKKNLSDQAMITL